MAGIIENGPSETIGFGKIYKNIKQAKKLRYGPLECRLGLNHKIQINKSIDVSEFKIVKA